MWVEGLEGGGEGAEEEEVVAAAEEEGGKDKPVPGGARDLEGCMSILPVLEDCKRRQPVLVANIGEQQWKVPV